MSKWRKKPVVVEAVRYIGGGNLAPDEATPDWIWTALADGTVRSTTGQRDFLIIKTLEGEMAVIPGDWIIRGVAGELYPCKPDIFDATYETVSDDELENNND